MDDPRLPGLGVVSSAGSKCGGSGEGSLLDFRPLTTESNMDIEDDVDVEAMGDTGRWGGIGRGVARDVRCEFAGEPEREVPRKSKGRRCADNGGRGESGEGGSTSGACGGVLVLRDMESDVSVSRSGMCIESLRRSNEPDLATNWRDKEDDFSRSLSSSLALRPRTSGRGEPSPAKLPVRGRRSLTGESLGGRDALLNSSLRSARWSLPFARGVANGPTPPSSESSSKSDSCSLGVRTESVLCSAGAAAGWRASRCLSLDTEPSAAAGEDDGPGLGVVVDAVSESLSSSGAPGALPLLCIMTEPASAAPGDVRGTLSLGGAVAVVVVVVELEDPVVDIRSRKRSAGTRGGLW